MPRNSKRLFSPQVENPNYLTMPYLSRERWISFWYQLMEVTEFLSSWKVRNLPCGEGCEPSDLKVLEIGPGPGIVSQILENMRISVTSVDIDVRLKPTTVADVTKLPFGDKSFDCVLAAEILEHIPFAEVGTAVKEIARVSRKSIVITLPHFSHFSPSFALKIFPFVPRVQKVFPISIFPPKHQFDGQHYWEIGKSGFSINSIRQLLTKSTGMKLVRDYLIEENPFHHMFVLTKV